MIYWSGSEGSGFPFKLPPFELVIAPPLIVAALTFFLTRFVLFEEDWFEAAVQMEDSRWHKQVTNRANRLIERMETLGRIYQIPT